MQDRVNVYLEELRYVRALAAVCQPDAVKIIDSLIKEVECITKNA